LVRKLDAGWNTNCDKKIVSRHEMLGLLKLHQKICQHVQYIHSLSWNTKRLQSLC
jgi:hypothetical protein